MMNPAPEGAMSRVGDGAIQFISTAPFPVALSAAKGPPAKPNVAIPCNALTHGTSSSTGPVGLMRFARGSFPSVRMTWDGGGMGRDVVVMNNAAAMKFPVRTRSQVPGSPTMLGFSARPSTPGFQAWVELAQRWAVSTGAGIDAGLKCARVEGGVKQLF